MADDEKIISGFYRNIPISIASGSVDGGRKVSIKQFPGRDTQSVEDLGLKPRKYTLEIIVGAKPGQDYFSYRNSLLAALELKEPGILIHPLYGRVDNIVATSYSLNENFSAFGDTTVSVNFEVSNTTGIPTTINNAITQTASLNDLVIQSVESDISELFGVTSSFTGNFTAAVNKINEIIDEAKKATAFIGEAADTLNEFSAQLGELSANVNSLVTAPLQLAQAITGLFESVNGLYASAGATFDTFTGFFGFGDDDDETKQNTFGRIERKNNNDVLNAAVAVSALGYAYLSIVRVDFTTTRQIDELTADLDDQFQLVQDGASSQDTKDAVTNLRVNVLQALEEVRVNVSQIVTVNTLPTTSRLLAFSYYGNDTQGEAITDLNTFTDVSFVEGDTEILTV